MNENYIELEVKIRIDNLAAVESQLLALGATPQTPRIFERNVRYDNLAGDFVAQGLVLRLREDDRIRLTYKGILDEQSAAQDGIQQRFEAEVTVSDFDAMQLILGKLGYLPYMTYEKYRTTYRFLETEVVLDEMPYGNFMEVEAASVAQIDAVLSALGLQDAPKIPHSYSRLFDFVRAHLALGFQDLTFANFDGVDVPPEAFYPPNKT